MSERYELTPCEEYGHLYEPCECEEGCKWRVCADCRNDYEEDE
ncbi:MAG TPA: hypothetical protein VIY48_15620 [Candidatus Paceibacterota bacterium]